ncbi:neuronal acetylcholine receptor subunit alpha-7-like [Apostichopus japonicus]|uniref:neuronal acetylcholine receptor subunit alpha-7-like n=1 Tax=Stichopus japonicus TaxID=307972 RepID=UPI003AB126C2
MDILTTCILLFIVSGIAARYPRSAEGELRHFLLNQENRSPRDRPVLNASDTVVVGLKVKFYAMLDLNEKDQVLTTASWLTMTWTDERMSWDPSNFSGVDLIHMYVDEIWTPKIFLSNSLSEKALGIVNSEGSILLTSNGHVQLGTAVVQSTQCPIIITYFPFDKHCPFSYLPDNLLAHQVYFYIVQPGQTHSLVSNQWDLLNRRKNITGCINGTWLNCIPVAYRGYIAIIKQDASDYRQLFDCNLYSCLSRCSFLFG